MMDSIHNDVGIHGTFYTIDSRCRNRSAHDNLIPRQGKEWEVGIKQMKKVSRKEGVHKWALWC